MSYSIEYFTSVDRYVVVQKDATGRIDVVAGYATRAEAEAKLKELTDES